MDQWQKLEGWISFKAHCSVTCIKPLIDHNNLLHYHL